MTIIVHRGTHQIGGCATEIATKNSRILIDFGAELNGNAPLDVDGVTYGARRCDAVLFTHYHGDHIGLLHHILPDIPLYIGNIALDILKLQNNRQHLFEDTVLGRVKPYTTGHSLQFGDITVTPYMVDHSAFDAHMFLIEADGKRVLHTGDFRGHGFRGKGLLPTLKKYIGHVDALICEGTTIDRGTAVSMTESDLLNSAKTLLNDNPYVFIACSSTNIDRIAAFCSAVPRGKYCVCDDYQQSIIQVVKDKCAKYSSLYAFAKLLTYSPYLDDKMKQRGFCMFIRPGGYLANKLLTQYKELDPLVIYSMWQGYLQNDNLKTALAGYRTVSLHTSGHADVQTLNRVIDIVKPTVLIPIHTTAPSRFPSTVSPLIVNDGDIIPL